MDNLIVPENDLVVIGIPQERFLIPEFVANRDAIMSTLGRHAIGIIEMRGHRVDRNRDSIVEQFLAYRSFPDWLLFLDSDMTFPNNIGFRLMSARVPVIGGLYFHRSQHYPFVMTEHVQTEDRYGRMRRSWTFRRQEVYDFLETARLPMRDSAVAIDGMDGRIVPCDAVGTGAMMVHRSVLEAMEPPWFEYQEMAESEDLTFCYRVKHELGLQVYADLGTVCGHFKNVPMGHKQFRESFKRRGVHGSTYDVQTAAIWLEDFAGILYGTEMLMSYSTTTLAELWENRGDTSDIDFYKSKEVGEAYLLDLLHWNESGGFNMFKNALVGIEDKKVLVIGAGVGTLAIQLAIQRNDVYAYEANEVLRDFAQKRWEWTAEEMVHSPVGEIQWRTELRPGTILPSEMVDSIDIVVCVDTFEHMPEKDLIGVFDILNMIVKRNGRVFFHNNFGQQDIYPMHHDHSEVWTDIIENAGFFQLEDTWLVKVYPMSRKDTAINGSLIDTDEIKYELP